jgi:predicted Zn finger-like uncharacterized protein
MRVACPECAAEYHLPPALAARVAEGRSVRCARCGASWVPEAPGGEDEAGDTAVPMDAPAPPQAFEAGEPPPRPSSAPLPSPSPSAAAETAEAGAPEGRSGGRVAGLAWGASVLLLALAAGAAWHWRVDLVEAWPPAARVFIALGAG